MTFTVTYWGITGSFPDPLRPEDVTAKLAAAIEHLAAQGRLEHLRPGAGLREAVARELQSLPFHLRSTYGGNTTCIEIQTPDALIIIDGGSGFRELGLDLQRRWGDPGYAGSRSAHVLVTHAHMDHNFSIPFFAPFYDPRNSFTIWGTRAALDALSAVLSPGSVLSQTYFPPTFAMMKAIKQFEEVEPWEEFRAGSTHVKTFPLQHPGGCLAFRLEHSGRSLVFASDHEQHETPDPALSDYAARTDLLYTEGQYTAAEYEGREGLAGEAPLSRRGWGHSTIEACVRTAVAAGVRRLHIGHRDPARSDEALARLEQYARDLAGELLRHEGRDPESLQVVIPHEGLTLSV